MGARICAFEVTKGKVDSPVVRAHWAADSKGITGMLGVTPELPPTYSTPLPRGRHTTSRLFSPHSGARWHIWCSGGLSSGHSVLPV